MESHVCKKCGCQYIDARNLRYHEMSTPNCSLTMSETIMYFMNKLRL